MSLPHSQLCLLNIMSGLYECFITCYFVCTMKKIIITTFTILFVLLQAQAQKNILGVVKGKIIDSAAKQPLADATIAVLKLADSSSVAFTISDTKGNFEIKDIESGDYRLLVTYQGYQNISKKFSINATNKFFDAATLLMEKRTLLLDEVIVEAAPITVKQDTIDYRASAFKTKPNATVEDLLKKLPGVQVEKDGTVKAQGEQVQKVYVDGKEFFGNDPKLATKNLTADMVETVQVYDDMSDQAKFTRIDDGSRQKAINIKLKKDKKQGMFGKANIGGGTNNRFDGNLSINRFKGTTQLSLIAAGNNVNKQGFSLSDIISTMGGFGGGGMGFGGTGGGNNNNGGSGIPGGMSMSAVSRTGGSSGGGGLSLFGLGSGSQGISRSWSAGLNYRDVWSKNIDVSGSYFFADTKTTTRQSSTRQSFFPADSVTYENRNSFSENDNQNHRFNFRLEWKIDSVSSFLYTPGFTVQHSESFTNDTSFTNAITPKLNFVAITGKTDSRSEREGVNLNNNFLYRRKLNKIGRTFTLGYNNVVNNSDGDGLNRSPFIFYEPNGSVQFALNQNQQSKQKTNGINNTVSTSYTEPVGKNKIIEINYAYSNNQNNSNRKTFDFNNTSAKYDVVNQQQTNYFENSFTSNRIGANFRKQAKKYNFQFGAAIQLATQQTASKRFINNKDTIVNTRQNFTNFFPSAVYNYNYGRGKSLRINYRGRTNAPTVSQLQDVPDVSNPSQISTGNPLLKQEFTNNISVNYTKFNIATAQFSSFVFNASNTSNKIGNSIDSFSKAVQITRPVNVNGVYNLTGVMAFGKPLKKLKGSMVNFNTIVFYNHDVSELYKNKNINTTILATQSASFNYNYKDKLDMGINASVTYNNTRYSVQTSLNNQYWSQTYSADFTYTFFKILLVGTDFDYFLNSGRASGFNQNIPMWNASLAKQIFKKKNGEIKLAVFDVLNQNKSINRSTGTNYILDTRTTVLQRYVMLSFQYNISKGAKAANGLMMPKMFRKGIDNIRVN
jgi:Outer membrane protein beta-barrel family/CarboxypepD_reg-like domain